MTYRDPKPGDRNRNGDYKVTLSSGGKRKVIYVGAPAFLSHAVDSPKAYDEAFRAAISFADYEGLSMSPEYSHSGELLIRRARTHVRLVKIPGSRPARY